MHRTVRVFQFLLLGMVLAPGALAGQDGWQVIVENRDATILLDTARVSASENGIVFAWLQLVYTRPKTFQGIPYGIERDWVAYDCRNRRTSIRGVRLYGEEGSLLHSDTPTSPEWQPLPDRGPGSGILQRVCSYAGAD